MKISARFSPLRLPKISPPKLHLSPEARLLTQRAFLIALAAYLAMIAGTAVAIYHGKQNRWTAVVEQVFPYPAGTVGLHVIPLSLFQREVSARLVYAHQHQLTVNQKEVEQNVSDQLANRILYANALQQNKIVVTDSDVQKRLDSINSEVGGQDKLIKFLHENYGPGIGIADFKTWLRALLVESAIQQQLLTHVQVSHILIALPDNPTDAQVTDAKNRALDVKSKITSTAQFADIAKQYSEDVASRDKGGDLGITNRGETASSFSPEFEKALFTLPVGQVSEPIRSRYGWHLILIKDRQGKIDESLAQFTANLRTKTQVRMFVGK